MAVQDIGVIMFGQKLVISLYHKFNDTWFDGK
jgi:hypothetical protein